MKLSFHGAAKTVTGSKHLIELDNGKKILLDCGLFQGLGSQTGTLNNSFGFDASSIDVLILSHAHIDHSGLIPKLVKEGFVGKIFCTPATQKLASILLEDSASIQTEDTKYINKKRQKIGQSPIDPLYSVNDAAKANKLFCAIEYNVWFAVTNNVEAMFTDAGHIIGSASVHLKINENNTIKTLTFSGDVGRYGDIILKSPQVFPQANYLIIESTYGNSLHNNETNATETLYNWIDKTITKQKGKLIIPAFSVGRTQEILFALNELSLQNRLPKVQVFVDSPLSQKATNILKEFPSYFNSDVQNTLQIDKDPFDFEGLHFIESADESKSINNILEPCIIIASSGMADAGRIKHHIANNILDAKNTILMSGYCESHSLGGQLLNGNTSVRIYGDFYNVLAQIGSMRSMSAHGDYKDLLQFVSCQNAQKTNQVFIVHGEEVVQSDFKQKLIDAGFGNVTIPAMHQLFEL
jgi:metallo-beta-lactamase family protein